MNEKAEAYRISHFVQGEQPPPVVVQVRSECSDPIHSIGQVKEVMTVVACQTGQSWPNDIEWELLLPDWFVSSIKLHTVEDIEANSRLWVWDGWLDAMQERGWEWWSSVTDEKGWTVFFTAHSWPYVIGPLEYLAYTSGATSVIVSDELGQVLKDEG